MRPVASAAGLDRTIARSGFGHVDRVGFAQTARFDGDYQLVFAGIPRESRARDFLSVQFNSHIRILGFRGRGKRVGGGGGRGFVLGHVSVEGGVKYEAADLELGQVSLRQSW